jgi:hypothetical protein
MEIIDFSTLFQKNGGHKLPVLVQLKKTKTDANPWRFISDNKDLEWEGNVYKAAAMSYKFPGSSGGVPQGGSLEIDLDLQRQDSNGFIEELLKWFDEADDKAELEVVGLIRDNEVRKISRMAQKHGTVSWDGRKITWNPGVDDRMNMQINAWVFNANLLTGYGVVNDK